MERAIRLSFVLAGASTYDSEIKNPKKGGWRDQIQNHLIARMIISPNQTISQSQIAGSELLVSRREPLPPPPTPHNRQTKLGSFFLSSPCPSHWRRRKKEKGKKGGEKVRRGGWVQGYVCCVSLFPVKAYTGPTQRSTQSSGATPQPRVTPSNSLTHYPPFESGATIPGTPSNTHRLFEIGAKKNNQTRVCPVFLLGKNNK